MYYVVDSYLEGYCVLSGYIRRLQGLIYSGKARHLDIIVNAERDTIAKKRYIAKVLVEEFCKN